MAQLLPVAFALPLALAFGGRLQRVGRLELRGLWLFFAAIGIQVVAFPFAFLPWTTSDDVAKALWLASYGLLLVAAALNRKILGAQIVAAGMALNLAAILANGGRMPATPGAMEAAGLDYAVRHNSVASADPLLPWLVDRFAAPAWVPWANVFSVGDAIIALGSVVLVFAATGAHLPAALRPRRRRAAVEPVVEPVQAVEDVVLEAVAEPVAEEIPAQADTVPAQSARHTREFERYASERVVARGGPSGMAASDSAARWTSRRRTWVVVGVAGAAGVAVGVHALRARRRRRARRRTG